LEGGAVMKRIAVVEDEVYMREELCDMLQKDGYLVEAITEFEDAARLLAALRPDLVILDLNLPEISGFQICQELKNKTAIPVLVLTSRDQVKDELQAFQLGADEYLTKPCRKDRLLARVSNILKRYEGRTNLIEGPTRFIFIIPLWCFQKIRENCWSLFCPAAMLWSRRSSFAWHYGEPRNT
jgi:DNA-binding response OmpR family regulator